MKRVVMLLVAAVVATCAVASGESTTMKYDLGAENAKWKFVAGQWARRASGPVVSDMARTVGRAG